MKPTDGQLNLEKYPRVRENPVARAWLELCALRGLSANTLDAYGRDLNDYLGFAAASGFAVEEATPEHGPLYVKHLRQQASARGQSVVHFDSKSGLANATMQRRLVTLRLFYDYLVQKRRVDVHPIPRGVFSLRHPSGGKAGLLPHVHRLPFVPADSEWGAIVRATRVESLRNRVMLCLAYEGALRREELCALEVSDIDTANRLVTVRAETSKSRRDRVVTYSVTTSRLYTAYLHELKRLGGPSPRLFRSYSDRNYGRPITGATWSKVVRRIGKRAGSERLSTHTFRHLYLTELARAGWELHEIAEYAGHRHPSTTLIYIHLSGRDLQAKIARSAGRLETQLAALAEVLA